jgi:hypothetical protein
MTKLLILLLALGAIGAFQLSTRDEYQVQSSSPFGAPTGRPETVQVSTSERMGLRALGGLCVVGCFYLIGGIRREREKGTVQMRQELALLLEELGTLASHPHGYPLQSTLNVARDLIDDGEETAAIETLCENLAQGEQLIERSTLERLLRLADYYKVDPQKCEPLRWYELEEESPPEDGTQTTQTFTE